MNKKLLSIIIFLLLNMQTYLAAAAEWTINSDFNNNGENWVARTWVWDVFDIYYYEPESPGEKTGEDFAKFIKVGNDWMAYLQADHDYKVGEPPFGYYRTVCAGVTQGWVWDENKPDGIVQPDPLPITPELSSLMMYTDIYEKWGWGLSWEYGILTDIWFKAYDVVKEVDGTYYYYPETVFGIDFYYDIGGRIYPSDGSMYDRLPVAFIYIKYNLGLGLRVNDILATMIEASQISPNYGIYFSHWNCKLYQVEALVEEAGGYARAKYKYLKVNYTYSSSSTSDYPTLLVLSENGWINEEPILICTNKDIYDIHVIKTFPIEYNGTYRLILKGAKQYTIQIDEIFLIAINSTTNKGFKLPLIKAIHSSKGNIEKQIKSRDKIYIEIKPKETIKLQFKALNTIKGQWKLMIIIKGKTKQL
ncbi:MAG: hypothetical protein NDF54_05145 [archaeon GB-1867-035]|nr:hypothetical protein [Candidatus Culexmicrobium profundum]